MSECHNLFLYFFETFVQLHQHLELHTPLSEIVIFQSNPFLLN